jgi:hypothetical protein
MLGLCVVGATWWLGTRKADFLTPPHEAQLAQLRDQVESSLPQAGQPADAVSAPAVVNPPPIPVPEEKPKPAIDPGDLGRAPSLLDYNDRAPMGGAHLMDLADLLEAKGEAQRALLAWERVLDIPNADPGHARRAMAAIQRLRAKLPAWNQGGKRAMAITLHATTSQKNINALTPLLQQSARDLERASAGILKVTISVSASHNKQTAHGPALVALRLSGPSPKAVSTPVLTFFIRSTAFLHQDLLNTEFLLIRDTLAHDSAHTAPAALALGENPLDALNSHITRRAWQDLGTRLKATMGKDESFAKKRKIH